MPAVPLHLLLLYTSFSLKIWPTDPECLRNSKIRKADSMWLSGPIRKWFKVVRKWRNGLWITFWVAFAEPQSHFWVAFRVFDLFRFWGSSGQIQVHNPKGIRAFEQHREAGIHAFWKSWPASHRIVLLTMSRWTAGHWCASVLWLVSPCGVPSDDTFCFPNQASQSGILREQSGTKMGNKRIKYLKTEVYIQAACLPLAGISLVASRGLESEHTPRGKEWFGTWWLGQWLCKTFCT